jgi:NADH:ubiquinone oxidoreductase subunit E
MSSIRPKTAELPEKIRKFITARLDRYPTTKALLVPVLIECQKYYGFVSEEHAQAIAAELKRPLAEVLSTISFYTMFRRNPSGKYIIALCGTWNCAHAGADKLKALIQDRCGIKVGETSANGLFTLEQVECLCDCHNAPSLQFLKSGEDFTAHWCNNLTTEVLNKVLDEIEAGEDDALRERLVRLEDKVNPPDEKTWVWLVTTHNQYPAWVETTDGERLLHDGYGKLGDIKQENPKLFKEIQEALKS